MERYKSIIGDMFNVFKNEVPDEKCKILIFPMISVAYLEVNNSDFIIPDETKWSLNIKSGIGIGKRLDAAINKIEDENPTLKGVLSIATYSNYDDTTIHKLALLINQLPIATKAKHIVGELIQQCAINEGKQGGDYFTPDSITELVMKLLNITKDGASLYDGAAGVGQFLNKATEYADHLALYGQEVDYIIWAIAKMNSILHGNLNIVLEHGETIWNPKFADDHIGLYTFDYVAMNGPFGLRDWGHDKAKNDKYGRFFPYGIPSKSHGDMAFVLHALASLNDKGKAVLVIPQGVLFRGGSEKQIRQNLIAQDYVETVIGLPSGLFTNTGLPVAILILNKAKPKDRKGKILFIDAEDNYKKIRHQKHVQLEDIEKIVSVYREGKEIKKFSKWVPNEDIIDDGSLMMKSYIEEDQLETTLGKVRVRRNEYEKIQTIPLCELATPFRGMNTPPNDQLESDRATHKLIELSNVQGGEILFDELTPVRVTDDKKIKSYELSPGDIIISSRGTAIKIAVVPETDERLLLSHHFIGIRPSHNVNSYFLKAFLEGPVGMFYLMNSQKGSGVSILTYKDIEEMPIPNLSIEKQNEIAEGFIQSDDEFKRKIEEAHNDQQKNYKVLYEEMGIAGAFTLIK